MGLFAALIVSVLAEEGWRAKTDVVEFHDTNYISWEADGVPENKWVSKGVKSIHFKKARKIRSETSYTQKPTVREVRIRFPRRKIQFEFETSYSGYGHGVYHLVLPRLMIPMQKTISPSPVMVEKYGERVAITWTFQGSIRPSFRFRKSSESEFENFRPRGKPIEMLLDPAFKDQVSEYAEKAKKEGEAIAGEALARYMEHPSRT